MKLLFLCLFLLSAFVSTAYERNRITDFPYRTVKLENSFLSLTFAPDQLGRLAELKLKKGNIPLTDTFRLKQYTETPLFYLNTDNFQGIRELFWRGSLSGVSPMQLKSKNKDSVIFETASYGGSNLGLRRKTSFEKESLIVNVESVFVNNGKRNEKIAVWLNLQGAPPAKPVIPVAAKGKVPMCGNVELYDRSFIFTGAGGNSNLPPDADWGGFRLPGRKVVWVLQVPAVKQGGFFYSWGNQDHRAPIRTVEPVFPEVTLAPGAKSPVCRYTIMVFPGLENINGLLEKCAVEVRPHAGGARILFCNAAPVSVKAEMRLTLLDRQNKVIFSKKYLLPPRKAGTVTAFQEKFSGKPASGTLTQKQSGAKLFFEKGE